MSKVLVTMSADWADEFDCEQFIIVENEETAKKIVEEAINTGGYFGTNEGFEEGDLSEYDFTTQVITDEEAETITKLLGRRFGTGIL